MSIAAIRERFPEVVDLYEFVARSHDSLALLGFSRGNSLACVSVCRDEICQPLVERVATRWGRPFVMGGLAGLLFLGRTGFCAALHHGPWEGGRQRFVFFGLTHIGWDDDGVQGSCRRPGQDEPSLACGALAGFQRELSGEGAQLEFAWDDLEYGLLKRRLAASISEQEVPDLVQVTRLARRAIDEDLARLAGDEIDAARADWAVFTGIQIHGPGGRELVWPGSAYAVIAGQRRELNL